MNYMVLGLIFGLVGLLIKLRLQKEFPLFYEEHGQKINFATIGLMCSLLIRACIDNMRYFDAAFQNHVETYENIYNGLLLVFCDIIPIGFQLSTMIFGYIRKKNEKKYRSEAERSQNISENKSDDERSSSAFISTSNNSSYFDPPLFNASQQAAGVNPHQTVTSSRQLSSECLSTGKQLVVVANEKNVNSLAQPSDQPNIIIEKNIA